MEQVYKPFMNFVSSPGIKRFFKIVLLIAAIVLLKPFILSFLGLVLLAVAIGVIIYFVGYLFLGIASLVLMVIAFGVALSLLGWLSYII
ncbi:hypothetical protein CUC43_34025 (plasmid) [Bacillus thuringiensis LM1212]|uniref:hypothetical protein n=1 Tax=Bacillus cereus group TaxID=86661 RepID=UPI00041F3F99|nr:MULTISPECIES: hypothetical protein [Bacillus cereus group]AXY11582.1 hypothetical protein CUC43_34025 [Bacillus thuringiensis LM1212]QDF27448.1 hypothetical protein FJR70_32475 [Bacillus tropicus]QUG99343.1 hypothetical protein HCM98_31530 [Bacillus tropicus]